MHKLTVILGAAGLALSLASCATTSSSEKGGSAPKAEPSWVSNPRSSYPEAQYVAATGYGEDRGTAEKDALGSLISIFGQKITGETTVSSRYSEAVKSGQVRVSEDSDVNRAVASSFDLESVVGAEIKDTWFDGKTYYAVAVMDKAKASLTYAKLIEDDEDTIRSLLDIPSSDRSTLDAYARYDLAATIADANARFLNVLSVLSPAQASAKRASVSNGDSLRVECLKIAQGIPIGIDVAGDRDGRIAAAFASVVSAAGFKSGGKDSRYVIKANVSFSEVVLNGNPNKFIRYLVDAKLTDTATGSVLVPYSTNGREGHVTASEAEVRALRAAETKIKDDYGAAFAEYLSRLTAKK